MPWVLKMKTLNEQFAESKGRAIQVDGHEVIPLFRIKLDCETTVKLVWRHTKSKYRQGITLKIDSGVLEVNEVTSPRMILWEDTCPSPINIRCLPKGKAANLTIWNSWEPEPGNVDSWLGNAGMVACKLADNRYEFSCSDGIGDADFRNLKFEIEF